MTVEAFFFPPPAQQPIHSCSQYPRLRDGKPLWFRYRRSSAFIRGFKQETSYAKQSQGEDSVKFGVSSVKQDGPEIESSDFKLHTLLPCETKPTRET